MVQRFLAGENFFFSVESILKISWMNLFLLSKVRARPAEEPLEGWLLLKKYLYQKLTES